MRARSARRLSVLPARTQLSSVDRSSAVNVGAVGNLLMPHHGIFRLSMQRNTRPSDLLQLPIAQREAQPAPLNLITKVTYDPNRERHEIPMREEPKLPQHPRIVEYPSPDYDRRRQPYN